LVLDHVNELNLDTPKVKFSLNEGGISADLVFGIDSKLFEIANRERDETEFTLEKDHHEKEVDIIVIKYDSGPDWTRSELDSFLSSLSVESSYRVKGVIKLDTESYILNWAFGRYSLTLLTKEINHTTKVHLNIMGLDLKNSVSSLEKLFGKGNVFLS
jgi:G3E family GTPase